MFQVAELYTFKLCGKKCQTNFVFYFTRIPLHCVLEFLHPSFNMLLTKQTDKF